MRLATAWLLVPVVGCGRGPDAPALLDTGWFPADDGLCGGVVQSTVPADGATDWYWRDPLTVLVAEPGAATSVRLVDALGAEVPTTVTADDTGLRLTVTPAHGLVPGSAHSLQLTDCRGTHEVGFTTSALGTPLDGGPLSLAHRTWMLDLVHGDWVQPGGFGTVLAGLLTEPPLLGASYVDPTRLDLLGAIGASGGDVIVQDTQWPTWDLPLGDFSEAPYFEARADQVVWHIASWPLPIEDFFLSGTFAADGATIGGMLLTGLVDTRGVGGAIGAPDNPGAICGFAGGLGVSCVPCSDGETYCLTAEIRTLQALEQPGVVLRPVLVE